MPDLIFHLGLTKTASCFLQKRVFGGKMNTLDRAVVWELDSAQAKEFEQVFRSRSPSFWRTDEAKTYLRYDRTKTSNLLVSHESLYEHVPFRPVHQQENIVAEPYLLAARLEEINRYTWKNGNVKAFFLFRKQSDWIPSIYAHVCYLLDNPSQIDFENRVRDFLNRDNRGGQVIEYDILLDALMSRLGETNVMALPYEAIGESETLTKIRKFTGLPDLGEGVDFNVRDVNVKKLPGEKDWRASELAQPRVLDSIGLVNKFRPQLRWLLKRAPFINDLRQKLPKKKELRISLDDALREEIDSFYRESNRRCADMLDSDLAKYGYY